MRTLHGRRIRVVHLITGLKMGGAEMALLRLVRSIDPERFENLVISMTDEGDVGPMLRAEGTEVLALGMRRGGAEIGKLGRLITTLRRLRPDILQSWMYHADFAALLTARLAGVRSTVWNIRCSYVEQAPFLLRAVTRCLGVASAVPDAVITNSVAGKAFHSSLGYRPRRWEVIPNGFDVGPFECNQADRELIRTQLGLAQNSIAIGLVARYHPVKDHSNFLRAAALLRARFPDVCFLLAGRGVTQENSALMAEIAELRLDGSVKLLGEVDGSAAINPALDIASLSSRGEGFPNVIGEAMACAIPCVATDVGDAAALIGDTGIVVPSRDPVALAEGWSRLIEAGTDERRRLGARARERIRSDFSLPASTHRYERLYAELAS